MEQAHLMSIVGKSSRLLWGSHQGAYQLEHAQQLGELGDAYHAEDLVRAREGGAVVVAPTAATYGLCQQQQVDLRAYVRGTLRRTYISV